MDDDTKFVLIAEYGSIVDYKTRTESGRGILQLVWYGVEEVIDIKRQDGTILHLYPGLGETAKIVLVGTIN